jgi:hypothetical protein
MATITNDFIVQNGLIVTNTATILSKVESNSTTTGALTVAGGIGLGGNLYVGGPQAVIQGNLTVGRTKLVVNSTRIESDNNVLHLSTASLNVNSAIGSGLSIGPVSGAYASLLFDGGTGFLGKISTATNIVGGEVGGIPYQSAAGVTRFIGIGPTNSILTSNGTTASWASLGELQIDRATTATNLDGGVAGSIVYQSATGITGFSSAGTAGQILVSRGTAAPVYQSTLTLAGTTAASSTTTGALQVAGGVGIGGNLYVGGSIVGSLTGNAQTASNLSGGQSGQLLYQITPSITGFVSSGTTGQLLVSGGGSGPNFQNTSTIAVGYADNITKGSAGQIPYQIVPGTTGFISTSAAGQVLVSRGTGAPTYQNTLTLSGTTAATSPTTGAFQVAGGAGIVGNLHVGGSMYGFLFGTATNIASGVAGSIPIQSGPNTTAFIPVGTPGQLLQAGTNTATFANTSTIQVGYAANLLGGIAGSIAYQTTANTTNFLAAGTSTYVLTSNGTMPIWSAPDGLTIGFSVTATNLSGIFPGSVPYQSAAGITAYTSGTAGQILVSGGTGPTRFQNTLTLTGTTESVSTTTGALVVAGGVGVGGNIFVSGTGTILATAASTTTLTANALYVAGGVGIGSSLMVTGPAVFQNDVTFSGTTTYVFSSSTVYTDSILELHYPNPSGVWTVNDGKDIGLRFHYYDTADRNAFLGRDSETGYLEWFGSGVESTTSTVTGTYGTFKTGSIVLTSTAANSGNTTTGALQVAGGVGIGGNLYVAGTINAVTISGIITTATSLSGGATGQIPIQSAAGSTAFIPLGTSGQLLIAGATTATWTSTSGLTVGNATTATNIASGTAGAIVYQTAAGATGFVTTASSGQVLVSGGTGAPIYQNTLTLAGTTATNSPTTGALQVAGGVGVAGNVFVGGVITATTFIGALTGVATTATNIAAGAQGSIPIQSAAGATAFIPLGTGGQLLIAGATTATWTSTSGLTVGNATTASNIAGGTTGVLVYQTSAGRTSFIGTGTTGSLLQMGANTATFVSSSTIQVGYAANVLGGAQGSIIYQSGADTSTSLPIGTNGFVLTSNGTQPQWTALSGLSAGTATTATNVANGTTGQIPYQIAPGSTGFINTGTLGSLLQMGANTATFVSTSSVTVRYAVDLLGGTAGQILYQVGPNDTGFVGPGTAGQILVSAGAAAPVYQSTLTLAGTTAVSSTITGALVVAGGVGIGGGLFVGGTVTATNFVGVITTATNLAAGTAGQVPYQVSPGVTNFYGPGTAGQVLVSGGTGSPAYQSTLTLLGTTAVSSPTTGALQIAGGVGVGGGIFSGGIVTATMFVGTLTGTASAANNISGGTTGSIPIQSASGATAFIPLGTGGHVLVAGASTATWQPLSGLASGTASTATHLANGVAGQIPYQTAPGQTSFVTTAASGFVLVSGGSGSPVYQNTLNLTGTTTANSTQSGALIVAGGVGIGGTIYTGQDVYVGRFAVRVGSGPNIGGASLNNTVVGEGALGSITSGYGNTAIGANALTQTTGSAYSTAVGSGALGLSQGQMNTAVGAQAAANNVSGTSNTAIGYDALGSNVSGSNNTAVGHGALGDNIAGTNNTALGHRALALNISGGGNVAIGSSALGSGSSGGQNIAIGTSALQSNTGSYNIAIGHDAGKDLTSGNGNVIIGNALGTAGLSNTIILSTGNGSERLRINSSGNTILSGTTNATSTASGALQVPGGVGIGGNLYVGGIIYGLANVVGTITTATNLVGSTPGSIPYQSAAGATSYVSGTIGTVLVSQGSGAPVFQNTLTLAGTTAATSTNTGALQVAGGVGIGGSLVVGGTVTATTFAGALTGTATTATNIAGGTAGVLPYQVSPGTTGFIGTGTVGSLLRMGTNTATFVSSSTVQVGYSVHLLGGSPGSLPYQSNANATTFLSIGSAGFVLTSSGTAPQWTAVNNLTAGNATTASNLAAGTPGQIPYQSASGSTLFFGPGTAGQVLVSRGTAAPVYQSTLTLAGTTAATSTNTGALQVEGGVGIGGNLYVGGEIVAQKLTIEFTTVTTTLVTTDDVIRTTNNTNATSTITGALQITGGAGIGRDLYVGGNIYGTFAGTVAGVVSTASQVNTVAQTANAVYYPAFVDSNNAAATAESVYTTSSFVINPSTGNIGIGLPTSQAKLNVLQNLSGTYGSAGVWITDNSTTSLLFNNISSGLSGIWSSGAIAFGSGANNFTERVRIDSSGNLGIGTTTPIAKLDVSGGARITGVTTITNTTQASSTITGALQVAGGAGIGRDLYVGGNIYGTFSGIVAGIVSTASQINTVLQTSANTYYLTFVDANNATAAAESVHTTSSFSITPSTGAVRIASTVASTSTLTGALLVTGGAGIGGDVNIGGALNAISKSFVIPHPTTPGKTLRHGSLEGPEFGVYVRGRLQGTVIELPDYWVNLVDQSSITVQLTPIGAYQSLFVQAIDNNRITIGNGEPLNKTIDCYYTVFAERKDVDKLEVES